MEDSINNLTSSSPSSPYPLTQTNTSSHTTVSSSSKPKSKTKSNFSKTPPLLQHHTYTKPKIKHIPHFIPSYIKTIIFNISQSLQDIINENYMTNAVSFIRRDFFYSDYILMISIEDYLTRIYSCSKMEIETLIMAIMYIDIMCDESKYVLSVNNIHKVIIAGCVVSVKYNEDIHGNNLFYAKIGSVPLEELNMMEGEFLFLNKFKLKIEESAYQKYYNYFIRDR